MPGSSLWTDWWYAFPNVLGSESASVVRLGVPIWMSARIIDMIWTVWELLNPPKRWWHVCGGLPFGFMASCDTNQLL